LFPDGYRNTSAAEANRHESEVLAGQCTVRNGKWYTVIASVDFPTLPLFLNLLFSTI
jgi:hypothetical protein